MISSIVFALLSLQALAAPAKSKMVNPGYDVEKVKNQMVALASHSWEFGTASEALLEFYTPELSVFGKPFPIPSNPVSPALDYAKRNISTNSQELVDGDGAVGDPASLGVFAVMLGQHNTSYLDAATREKDFIFSAPRYSNGAISQRDDVAELWADFIYMAPPFLAYYGAATKNASMVREAATQCGLYRQILQDDGGLWLHIIGPQSQDAKHWSTGNAWAAAGMTRVLATIMKWETSKGWTTEQNNLKTWIKEILDAAIAAPKDNGLLRNYIDIDTWFGEISGTGLLSATAYRMRTLDPAMFGTSYSEWADANRKVIATHVNSTGIVSPAVNPLNWNDETPFTTGSPEGQAFTVLLYTAYRDCVNAKLC